MKPTIDFKPWGKEHIFTMNEKSTVKILVVKKGEHPSLQYHKRRDELWRIIKGRAIVTKGNRKLKAEAGDEFYIPKKQNILLKLLQALLRCLRSASVNSTA